MSTRAASWSVSPVPFPSVAYHPLRAAPYHLNRPREITQSARETEREKKTLSEWQGQEAWKLSMSPNAFCYVPAWESKKVNWWNDYMVEVGTVGEVKGDFGVVKSVDISPLKQLYGTLKIFQNRSCQKRTNTTEGTKRISQNRYISIHLGKWFVLKILLR